MQEENTNSKKDIANQINKIKNDFDSGLINEKQLEILIDDIAKNQTEEFIAYGLSFKNSSENSSENSSDNSAIKDLYTNVEFAPSQSIESPRLLDTLTDQKGIVHHSLSISGEQIVTFNKIKIIKGDLIFSDSKIKSLGSIQEVHGDLWISNRHFKIDLTSLGSLKLVKGDLSLHNTSISDLGCLESVEGLLRLPKTFKNKIDVSNINIGDRIIFSEPIRKNPYYYKTKPTKIYEGVIPFWHSTYMALKGFYSSPSELLANATTDQKSFYYIFKDGFYNEEYYDLEGNTNYLYILYFDIIKNFDFSKLEYLNKLKAHYYRHIGQTIDIFIKDYLISENNYIEALALIMDSQLAFNSSDVAFFIKKINPLNLTPSMLFKILSYTTERYDDEKTKKLFPLVTDEIEKTEKELGKSFFNQFFDGQFNIICNGDILDIEFYKKFFTDSFNFYLMLDKSNNCSSLKKENSQFSHVFEKAIWFELKKILENANEQLLQIENPKEFERLQIKKKNTKILDELRIAEYYDCKEEKIITIEQISTIVGKKILSSIFKTKNSLYGRFILNEGKESNRVFTQWKTVIDIETGQKKRFNKEGFAKHVNVDSRSVWGFFNGRQKQYNKRYEIFSLENEKP